jgi:hypothetical protein
MKGEVNLPAKRPLNYTENNLTFLKFYPSRRVRCYYAMAHDMLVVLQNY